MSARDYRSQYVVGTAYAVVSTHLDRISALVAADAAYRADPSVPVTIQLVKANR